MSQENSSPPDSLQSPMRVSGKLFVIVLIPVIILALGWLIYARMQFRAAVHPEPSKSALQ